MSAFEIRGPILVTLLFLWELMYDQGRIMLIGWVMTAQSIAAWQFKEYGRLGLPMIMYQSKLI